MTDADLAAYAALLLDSCLRVGEGDRLRIAAEFEHRPLVRVLVRGAWERGARSVRCEWIDDQATRAFLDLAREAWLDEVPSQLARDSLAYVEEGWSILSLVGSEDPEALAGADPARTQRMSRARQAAAKPLRDAVRSNRVAWCVAPVPTAAWGRAVLGAAGRDPGPDPRESLWAALKPILRLDSPDPAAELAAHASALASRARTLDRASLRELRFTGPGTDLRIGLSPRSKWVGGDSVTPAGKVFVANHPTEEVFTSPDRRLASGRVACTRPVKVLGETVEGAWFVFEGGRVTASGASKGAEVLGRYLDIDAGARSLGEVALVDAAGPIWKSGLVFDNGLIDENAACHIALGAAYYDAFEGAEGLDEAGKAELGFNESMVHVDFMIGSEKVEVVGVSVEGEELPIIRGGKYLLYEL